MKACCCRNHYWISISTLEQVCFHSISSLIGLDVCFVVRGVCCGRGGLGMAKKPSWGKGQGRGNLKVTIGSGNDFVTPDSVVDHGLSLETHDLAPKTDFGVDNPYIDAIEFPEVGFSIVQTEVELPVVNQEVGPSIVDAESTLSEFVDPFLLSREDLGEPIADSGDERLQPESPTVALGTNPASRVDWRKLFQSTHALGKLDYVAPRKSGAKVVASPHVDAVE